MTSPLAHRIYEACSLLAEATGAAVERVDPSLRPAYTKIGTGSAVLCGPGSPLTQCNRLFFESEFDPNQLDEAEAFFAGRTDQWEYSVTPFQALELLPAVIERGWTQVSYENVMVLELASLDLPAVSTLRVTRVSPHETATWARIATEAFFGSDVPVGLENLSTVIAHTADTHAFLAWEGDEAIAAATVAVTGATAYLGGAATLPQHRGKGAQAALLRSRLQFASDRGCDLAMCECTPGSQSQRNQERAGFRVAYTKLVLTRPPRN